MITHDALVELIRKTAADLAAALTSPVEPPPVPVPPVPVPPVPVPPTPATSILRTDGRNLKDASNAVFIPRGVEQMILSVGDFNKVDNWIAAFKRLGANAVRFNKFFGLTDAQVISIHQKTHAAGLVPYVTPPERIGIGWFETPAVKGALQALPNLVIDALLEQEGTDVQAWLGLVKASIARLRGAGYKGALHFHSIQQGRNLREVLNHSAEIIAFDPLHNCFGGAQLYWPVPPAWQWSNEQGFGSGDVGLVAAFAAIKSAPFPVQVGFALGDEGKRPLALARMLGLAADAGIGFLHWDAYEGNAQDTLFTSDAMTTLTAGGLIYDASAFGFRTAVPARGF